MKSSKSDGYWRRTMAKRRKTSPEKEAELDKRAREFRELLEKRQLRDAELAAERKRRRAS
jgi:hypothetical protein